MVLALAHSVYPMDETKYLMCRLQGQCMYHTLRGWPSWLYPTCAEPRIERLGDHGLYSRLHAANDMCMVGISVRM